MVVAYVRLFSSLGPQPSLPASRIYALLLPSATSCEWDEISIQRSTLGGEGVFPSDAGHIDWCDVGATPVLMPYLGADTVVHDAHTLRSLVEVLQGSFQCVTVGELRAKGGTRQPHVADGLFAVPPSVRRQERALRPVNDRGRKEAAAPTTKLLQVVRWHDVAGVRGGRGGVRPDAPW